MAGAGRENLAGMNFLHARKTLSPRIGGGTPGTGRRFPVRCVLILLLCFTLLSLPVSSIADDHQLHRAREHELKAIYLYNLLYFIRWPAGKNVEGDLKIAIVGRSPLGEVFVDLQKELGNRGKRSISVTSYLRFEKSLDLRSSHLVFVSSTEEENITSIIAGLDNAPVLTVSDVEGFLDKGGMVGLVLTPDNLVRWEINRTSLERTGLRISAKMLQLAVRVINGQ